MRYVTLFITFLHVIYDSVIYMTDSSSLLADWFVLHNFFMSVLIWLQHLWHREMQLNFSEQ